MTSLSMLTNVGRNKEAQALATGEAVEITHIAWGDGDRIPAGGETELLNEQGRKLVINHGVSPDIPNGAYFEILLTEDEGPFLIREAGLFDADGDMIAIVRFDPAQPKPINNTSMHIRIGVVFSDLENLVLRIESASDFVPASRNLTAGTGLSGGGDLSADRRFDVDFADVPEAVAGVLANKALSPATSAAQIAAAVDALIDGAPGSMDTLKELADAIADNTVLDMLTNQLALKLDIDIGTDGIGAYVLAIHTPGGVIPRNTLVSGADLEASNTAGSGTSNDTLPGTWRCHGWTGTSTSATLFQRVA